MTDDRGLAALAEQAEEELVIRDWLAGQLSPSGAPLPPSRRTSTPLPRRQVTAVVATLVGLLDEARQVATDYITALNDCRDSGRFSPDGGLDALTEAQRTIEAMSGDAADLHDLIGEAAAMRTVLAHLLGDRGRIHDSGCGTCDAGRALLTGDHELPSALATPKEEQG